MFPLLRDSLPCSADSLSVGDRAPLAAGSPLTLSSLLSSTILHPRPTAPFYPFTTLSSPSPSSAEAPAFPFLSQGEHPTLGTPAWFLHPCETEGVMRDVLETECESEEPGHGGEGWRGRWLKSWLMVVGSVVDLRK